MKTLVLILSLIWPSWALAIVNVESLRPKNQKQEVFGQFKVTGSGQSGNTDKVALKGENFTVFNDESRQNFLILKYNYGETNKVKDTNNSFFHARHVKYFRSELAYELFTQWQHNEFRRLALRALGGAGVRWEFFKKKKSLFATGLGGFYYYEDLKANALEAQQIERNGRGNVYLAMEYMLKESVKTLLTFYYQPKVDEIKDFHIYASASLKFGLTKSLSLILEGELGHDSRPPLGVENTDSSYLMGFSIDY